MKSKVPVHEQLMKDLRKDILDRRILSGTMLPPENTLAEKYNISRPSVRKALAELEKQRLVEKRPGLGTFITDIDSAKNHTPGTPSFIGIDIARSGLDSWYYTELAKGARLGCAKMNSILVFTDENDFATHPDIPLKGQILTRLDEWPKEQVNDIKRRGIPVTTINRMLKESLFNWVAVDFEQESFKAVEYLIQIGHRKIGIITDMNPAVGVLRKNGYLAALKKHNINPDEKLIFARTPAQNVIEDIVHFLKSSGATAYFFASAAYFVNHFSAALSHLKLRVPEDISIIVFEDIQDHEKHPWPPLSCIKVPLQAIGERAAQILAGYKTTEIREFFKADLVIRESCRSI